MSTTALYLPTSATSDATAWANPTNVKDDNDGSAAAVATVSRSIRYPSGYTVRSSGLLVAGFVLAGFSVYIASGDTVDGFEIEVRAKCSNADMGIMLRAAPQYGSFEAQQLTEEWAVYTFGGPTSTFGAPLLRRSGTAVRTAAAIISADPTIGYGSATVSIDYVKIRFYYSATSAAAYSFTPQTGVALGEWVYSNVIAISGMPYGFVAPTSFAGQGFADSRISNAEICKNNSGKWVSTLDDTADGEGSVNGDTYQIRRRQFYARLTDDFAESYPLTVHGITKYFTMTTVAPVVTLSETFAPRASEGLPRGQLVKAPFTFKVDGVNTLSYGDGHQLENETTADVAISYFHSTGVATLQKITDSANPFHANPYVRDALPESYNFEAVYNGGQIEYWVTTAAGFGVSDSIDGWVFGDQTPAWSFTTEAETLTPTQAYWASPAAVSTSAVTEADTPITIAGINGTATVTFVTSGGTTHEFQKNGGAWTAVGGGTTVVNGDTIGVRMVAPGAGSQSGNVVMKVNGSTGMCAAFTIVTTGGDVTPSAFTFTDVTNAIPGLLYTSNAQVLAGVTAAQPILATVSPGFQIRVGAGTWTDGALSVQNGDSITIRGNAPLQAGKTATCVVTIGGTQDTWTITTRAASAFWD